MINISEITQECKTCWHYRAETDGAGLCRRYPPSKLDPQAASRNLEDPVYWCHPAVDGEWCCGEWKMDRDAIPDDPQFVGTRNELIAIYRALGQ